MQEQEEKGGNRRVMAVLGSYKGLFIQVTARLFKRKSKILKGKYYFIKRICSILTGIPDFIYRITDYPKDISYFFK